MSQAIWLILGVGAAALILWGSARIIVRRAEPLPSGESLPATPLQRASWWSLGTSLTLAAIAAALPVSVGVERVFANAALRVTFELLVLASIVAAAGGVFWLVRKAGGGAAALDERDRAILGRAPAVQSVATILTLALWTVVLTERFATIGAVPLTYLQILFWSCLLVNLLGLPVGILVGYRRL